MSRQSRTNDGSLTPTVTETSVLTRKQQRFHWKSFHCFSLPHVWTNWMFIFVSSVLIGGSPSLPLASWLTFGLSCLLALLYRWWELPRTPSVCSVTDAAPAFALSPPPVLSLLSPLCPAPVVLLSFLHFIRSCLAERQHGTVVCPLDAFFKPLRSR